MPQRARRSRGRAKHGRKRPRFKRRRATPWRKLTKLWPRPATRRRWYRRLRSAPPGLGLALVLTIVGLAWLSANWVYQVFRKPSELFFPVSGAFYKTPQQTWRSYGPLFRRHSTATITPDLLAALAQVEGSGNPIVRTYWRWKFHPGPFEIYRPASSAVGMYQITDGTFAEARRYCIHDHVVVEDGPWYDWKSCWFNRLYTRTIPSHAVELTSAYLDRSVATILARHGIRQASLQQKHALATLIHLCGAGAGNRFAARGFRLLPNQRCGDHSARAYIDKVASMQQTFRRLEAAERH